MSQNSSSRVVQGEHKCLTVKRGFLQILGPLLGGAAVMRAVFVLLGDPEGALVLNNARTPDFTSRTQEKGHHLQHWLLKPCAFSRVFGQCWA